MARASWHILPLLSGQLALALVCECEQACGHILLNYQSLGGTVKYRTVSELCPPERLRWEFISGAGVSLPLAHCCPHTG